MNILIIYINGECFTWSQREKTCLLGFVNIIGAYQPGRLHRLMNFFVIRLLESIIPKLAMNEI